MEKRKKLEMIPDIAYPYKVIHSYFINFHNTNKYGVIKQAVLGIDDYQNEFLKYYLFYQLCMSYQDINDYEILIPYFDLIFAKKLDNDSINLLVKALSEKNYLIGIATIFINIKKFSKETGFFLYMVMQKMINEYYGSLIKIPLDLYETVKCSKNSSTIAYYMNGIFNKQRRETKRELLENIQETYRLNKNYFTKLKIKNIYLFGSVMYNNYHRESDIDMVVDFNECSYSEKSLAFDEIRQFNWKHFDRKTDLQEFHDFIEYNPNIKILELL